MAFYQLRVEEILTFFAVLIRYSILFSIMPFFGDRLVPPPIKVLLSIAISVCLFPSLLSAHWVRAQDAKIWAASAGPLVATLTLEVLFALTLGFISRLAFDGVSFGANLVGNFMGFGSATTYDPHQDTHTEVIAQLQTTLAMLLFLTFDGHHLLLRAAIQSYRIVGLGGMGFYTSMSTQMIQMTSEVLLIGIQIAAPIAISLFGVNVAFGVLSKAMPQLNVFVLSFAVSTLLGFLVLLLSLENFSGVLHVIFDRVGDLMLQMMQAIASRR